jgi:hypothetical protein
MTGTDEGAAATADTGASPLSPGQVRALKFAVVGMAVLIVLGVGAVAVGMVQRASQIGKVGAGAPGRPQGATAEVVLPALAEKAKVALPAGADVRSMALDGRHLALHYDSPQGRGVVVVDLVAGRVASRIELTSEAAR